jgi:hypothetical protein
MKYFPPLLYRHEHQFRDEFDPEYQSRYDKFVASCKCEMHSNYTVSIYMGTLVFLATCIGSIFLYLMPVDPGMSAILLSPLFLVPLAYWTHYVLTVHHLYRRYFPIK